MPSIRSFAYTRWVQIRNERDETLRNVRFVYRTGSGGTLSIPVIDALEPGELATLPLANLKIRAVVPYASADGLKDSGELRTEATGDYLRFVHLAFCKGGNVGGLGRFSRPNEDGNSIAVWPC